MYDKIKNLTDKNSFFLMAAIFSYFFSLGLKLLWIKFYGNDPMWSIDGHYMLNTNDGYFFMEGVKSLLYGGTEDIARIPLAEQYGLVWITAMIVKITGLPIEEVSFYLPPVISTLVVFPVIGIARLFKMGYFSLFAGILSAIAWSYYNRTLVGYYDTDMFAILMPLAEVYFLIKFIRTKELKEVAIAGLFSVLGFYFYDQALVLMFSLYITFLTVFFYINRNSLNSLALGSIILGSAFFFKEDVMLGIAYFSITTAILLRENISNTLQNTTGKLKTILYVLALANFVAVLGETSVFSVIFSKLHYYLSEGVANKGALNFFQVNKTIQEANPIGFERLALRVSGNVFTFLFSIAGLALLVKRYKEALIFAPFIAIGLFSLFGGLRFTIYLIPAAALGLTYLFYSFSQYKKISKAIAIWIPVILMVWVIAINVLHIAAYATGPVFYKPEVESLKKLKKEGSPKDLVISWWDYGYPIKYYANKNVLIDGGKHNQDNFLISKLLLSESPEKTYNLAKLIGMNYSAGLEKKPVVYKLIDTNNSKNLFIKPQQSTLNKNIYFVYPIQMLPLFNTIAKFSTLNPKTGEKYGVPFFRQYSSIRKKGDAFLLPDGSSIDLSRGLYILPNQKAYKIKSFTVYDPFGNSTSQEGDKNGIFHVIYNRFYKRMYVMDDKAFNTNFVQMGILVVYDNRYFSKVEDNPMIKIYKLKKK